MSSELSMFLNVCPPLYSEPRSNLSLGRKAWPLLRCSWDVGALPKDEGMGLHGGRVNRCMHGLGPGRGGSPRGQAVPSASRGWLLLALSLSCSWGLRMEQSAASVPAALPYYVAFSQLLGLTVVAVTGAWLGLYRGGIAWESSLQFNVHPLCMVMGMIFLQGDGESRGASSLQPLLCASVCSRLWERQGAGVLSPQTFRPFRQIGDCRQDRGVFKLGRVQGSCGWRPIAALQPVTLVPASGFCRWHLRGYSCLLDKAGPGWVMSYLQGQLEVGKGSGHRCMRVLLRVDMAELVSVPGVRTSRCLALAQPLRPGWGGRGDDSRLLGGIQGSRNQAGPH